MGHQAHNLPTLVWTKAAPILGAQQDSHFGLLNMAWVSSQRAHRRDRDQQRTPDGNGGCRICHDQPPWLNTYPQNNQRHAQQMGFTHSLPRSAHQAPQQNTTQHKSSTRRALRGGSSSTGTRAGCSAGGSVLQSSERALMRPQSRGRLLFSTRWRGTAMGDTITQAMATIRNYQIPLAQPSLAL
jgi:hypothetical protein